MRLQYQFLIPKYPPGTFSIYSRLGGDIQGEAGGWSLSGPGRAGAAK